MENGNNKTGPDTLQLEMDLSKKFEVEESTRQK